MGKSLSSLVVTIDQVRLTLKTAPLSQLVAVKSLSEKFDEVSVRLAKGRCPTPADIRHLSALLWSVRMREAKNYGRQSAAMSALEQGVERLDRIYNTLNERWIYRQWAASRSSAMLSVLFVPYLLFSLALWLGCPLLVCSILMGGYLLGMSGLALWAKDPVWLFWSVYSYVPLYIFWNT